MDVLKGTGAFDGERKKMVMPPDCNVHDAFERKRCRTHGPSSYDGRDFAMNLKQAFDDATSHFNGDNFALLSLRHLVLVAIWGVEAEVNNGGFSQYYYNGAGDQAWFAAQALRTLGTASSRTIRTTWAH